MLQYRVNSVLPVGCSVCVLKLTCRGWRWAKYSTTSLFLWHYLKLLLREMVTLCSHRDAPEKFSFIKRQLKVSTLVNGRCRQSLILSGNLLLPREVFCPGRSPQPELYYLKVERNSFWGQSPLFSHNLLPAELSQCPGLALCTPVLSCCARQSFGRFWIRFKHTAKFVDNTAVPCN